MNTPTTRETADHAELAAELRAFEGSDDLGNGDFTVCEFAADALDALLSEIAALRGDLTETRVAADLLVSSVRADLRQAERQRDELRKALKAVSELTEKDVSSRGLLGVVELLVEIQTTARTILANQGADQ